MQHKPLSRAQALLIFILLALAIAAGLSLFSSASTIFDLLKKATAGLFLPILLSLIMSFLLEPFVLRLTRNHFNRTISIFIVYAVIAAGLLLATLWFAPHWATMWNSLISDLPRYISQGLDYLREWQDMAQKHFPVIEGYNFAAQARTYAEQFLTYVLVQAPSSALKLGSLMLLVPLFSFFFLRDGRQILRAAITQTPNRSFEMVREISFHVSRQMAHFIRGRILEALIIGLVVSVGLSFTDIRYAPLLGAFAGICNLVPYVGPIVGMVPGILIAMVDLGTGGEFWWIVILYFLVAQVIVDNFILIPILISRVSNLHPLLVILAIIMGGKLYGVLGMIIGVPVASIFKIAFIESRRYRRAFSLLDAPIDIPAPKTQESGGRIYSS